MPMSQNELEDLKYAKELLENPGLAARITDALGTAIDKGFELLPAKWSEMVQQTTKESLRKALEFAVITMDDRPRVSSWSFLHKMLAATSGAVGGAFGLPALTVELPVSTIIMLRSIADIARSEGEKIKTLEAKLACLEVFALGGKSHGDDSTETGYFVVRAAFAREVSEAVKYITKKGFAEGSAPAISRFITTIASRFGVNVSEKDFQVHNHNCIPFWSKRLRENCSTGCAYNWSSRRCIDKHDFYRSFSRHGPGSLYCTQA